jgi:phosphatidylglycerophosphate synthase
MSNNAESGQRRPLKSRNTKWAYVGAKTLFNLGATPNSISILSVVFAGAAGIFFFMSTEREHGWPFLIAGAIFVQLRLLCNLLDGMVAVEFGVKSKSGELFNDVPDRFADIFIILGVAYSIKSLSYAKELGWIAACLAVITAYVRALGVATGAKAYFLGPMAKPQRMATITIAALLGIGERILNGSDYILFTALCLIAVGCLITTFRRLAAIRRELEGKP